jgi:hypothetical protein
MQSTIPVQRQQESRADAKNLALGISVGLLAASIGALIPSTRAGGSVVQ